MFIPISRVKSLRKAGQPLPAGATLQKLVASTIEPLDARRVRYTISTASVDRDNDTVSVDGWNLDTYLRNPVVLWGHQQGALPIGRCIDIGANGAALKAVVEFVPHDMPVCGELAEAVLRMSRTGFLSATSVGFRPLEFEVAKDRDEGDSWFPPLDFKRQELMEFSVVSIPANPEALIEPADRVADMAPVLMQAEARELSWHDIVPESVRDSFRASTRDEVLATLRAEAAAEAEAKRIAETSLRRKLRKLEARRIAVIG